MGKRRHEAILAKRASYGIDRPDIILGGPLLGTLSLAIGVLTNWPMHTPLLSTGVILWAGSLFFALANPLKPRAVREVLDTMSWRGDEVVLDVGCGRGLWLISAAKHLTIGRAIGVDIWSKRLQSGNSPEKTLENARIENVSARVEVREAKAQQLPFGDATFDVVLSSLVVHHVPKNERKTALLEMVRVMKPGGRLAMLEIFGQVEAYRKIFEEAGMMDIQTKWSKPLIFFFFRYLKAKKPA